MEFNSQNVYSIEKKDVEFQSYMSKVYSNMACGLGLSGVMAFFTTKEPLLSLFYKLTENGVVTFSGLGWLSLIAPIIMVLMINSQSNQLNSVKVQLYFIIFSALMGISLSNVFLMYTATSIVQSFLVTAGSFFCLSVYGKTTKRDLSAWGSFLTMGLFGLIITLVVNLFMKSAFLSMAASLVGVLIFAGFVAYDTHKMKEIYQQASSQEERDVMAVRGALSLYLDFINLFMYAINFLGERK